MTNRYADDIKRIVDIDPNQSVLGDPEDKASIPSGRGIGYINATTGGAQAVSGEAGESQLSPDKAQGGLEPQPPNESGQKALNPNELQNGVIDSEAGIEDACDVINGDSESSKVSTPQTTSSGLAYTNTNALNAIDAQDCDSASDINIRTRHDLIPPDAVFDSNGNELTPDWEDAEIAPEISGYEQGKYWNLTGLGSPTNNVQAESAYYTALAAIPILNAQGPDAPYTFDRLESSGPNSFNVYFNGDTSPINLPTAKVDCIGSPPDASGTCPATAPKEECWPTTGTYYLKLDDGQFTSSQFDCEAPAKHKDPSSKVDFCFCGGIRQGTIESTRNGGHMIYETVVGIPTGTVRAYDSSGIMIGTFDAAQIKDYRPVPAP